MFYLFSNMRDFIMVASKKTKRKTAKRKTVKKAAPKRKTAKKVVKRRAAKKVVKRKVAKKAVKRKVVKKAVKRKVVKKRVAKKKAVLKKVAMPPVKNKPFTKGLICSAIAAHVGITKQQVHEVLMSMHELVHGHLKKGHPFTMPGLLKIVVVRKAATKARRGINPFTGEEMMFKAKPARNVVKVRPLKNLKEMV
jgi:nucleoid DNA-binding protein